MAHRSPFNTISKLTCKPFTFKSLFGLCKDNQNRKSKRMQKTKHTIAMNSNQVKTSSVVSDPG